MTDGRYTAEDHAAYRRRVEDEQRRAEAERREATKEAARKAWIADGGSFASFDRAWDTLEAERRKERLREAADAARQSQRGISTI